MSNRAQYGGGVFAVDSTVVARDNARIMHGYANNGGGVFLWNSTGVFEGAYVRENIAGYGGGLYAQHTCALQFVSCVVESNVALYGGGMYLFGAPSAVQISNTMMRHNSGIFVGGALYVDRCREIDVGGHSRMEGNSAQAVGAAFFDVCSSARLHEVVFVGNSAWQHAGAFIRNGEEFDVVDCDFINNVATNSECGAVTIHGARGRLRTEGRPAKMVGNGSQAGGALAVVAPAVLTIEAPAHPLNIASNLAHGAGGALWAVGSVTVRVAGAVQFIGNTSVWGGAIMATNQAMVTLHPTNGAAPVFAGNGAANSGGAICLMASAQVTAANCTFAENTAGIFGGAIRNAHSYLRIEANFGEAMDVIPNVFRGNRAMYGGAIHSYQAPQTMLDSALMVSNRASSVGGGVRMMQGSHADLINCVIAHNASLNSGGGVAIDNTSVGQLRHCTVIGNAADGVASSGGVLALSNCIVRGNTPGQISAGYTVHFSEVEGGYPGAGNIDADPLFENAAECEYALAYGSPCVNAGTAAGVTWDCVGKPRPMGAGYDMGAYEQDPAPVQRVTPAVLDFGDVVVGDSATLPVSVMNTGNSDLNGTVNFVPVPIFTVNPGSYTVAPFETTNVLVTFSPPMEYRWTQTVVFASNGGNTNVTLIGTGIAEPGVIGLLGVIGLVGLVGRGKPSGRAGSSRRQM